MKHELSPRGRFVLLYGVVFYGGGIFLIFNAIHFIRLYQQGASMAGIVPWLAVTAIISPLLGLLFGIAMWNRLAARDRRK